ncbi:PQQ-dependent sugar dehydrogenase [Occallatibacter savannae]|uniref:PQQ-dependent sugar dehydrogenase n=1 Tax=Occallatibacter savannae TaxID=1002691 RepID=UPI000D69D75E|nr:PQQ-dependent sugar dehydrogenase [Occallatibacter savannae]
MMHRYIAAWFLALIAACASAQINAGNQPSSTNVPFTITQVASLRLPWRIAFLPDGRMLVTEKVGGLVLVTPQGDKTAVANVPAVLWEGQGGMLGVFTSPHYAQDHSIYLTYAEPGVDVNNDGSSLALARAQLKISAATASLENLKVIWRDGERGLGGQFGAAIAFSPDSKYLYLAVGERQRMTPAQDPNQPLGKILRLTLDGKPAPGNPMAGKLGASQVPIIDPPGDTEAAKTAPVVRTYTFPGPNLTPSETWATGFRTPYGLAFAPDGRLWELEHGPRGGDELNLIEPGKNYGWPLVSYGINYNGVPIPSHDTRSDLAKPVIYWAPVIAPGNLMFYHGSMFPQWKGSGFASGLGSQAIIRMTFDSNGGAKAVDRWDVKCRVRDIEEAPDGSLWMVEDANPGGLFRLTPIGMAVSAPTPKSDALATKPASSLPANATPAQRVQSIIQNNNCLSCHRIGKTGGDLAPSLNGIGSKRTPDQIRAAIVSPVPSVGANYKNPMPSYKNSITGRDLNLLIQYLRMLPAKPQ